MQFRRLERVASWKEGNFRSLLGRLHPRAEDRKGAFEGRQRAEAWGAGSPSLGTNWPREK